MWQQDGIVLQRSCFPLKRTQKLVLSSFLSPTPLLESFVTSQDNLSPFIYLLQWIFGQSGAFSQKCSGESQYFLETAVSFLFFFS